MIIGEHGPETLSRAPFDEQLLRVPQPGELAPRSRRKFDAVLHIERRRSMPDFPLLMHTAVDAPDCRGLAEFYRELLGLHCRPGDEPPSDGSEDDADWLVLLDAQGRRALAVQEKSDMKRPTWPSEDVSMQLHLDFRVPHRRGPGAASRSAPSPSARRCSTTARRRGRAALRSRGPRRAPVLLPRQRRVVIGAPDHRSVGRGAAFGDREASGPLPLVLPRRPLSTCFGAMDRLPAGLTCASLRIDQPDPPRGRVWTQAARRRRNEAEEAPRARQKRDISPHAHGEPRVDVLIRRTSRSSLVRASRARQLLATRSASACSIDDLASGESWAVRSGSRPRRVGAVVLTPRNQ